MKKFILGLMIVLFPLSLSGAVTRQTYTNKNSSVVGRAYTSGPNTVYRDSKGNTLGFSRDTKMGGKDVTRIMDKDGTYKGMIIDGLIKDSRGKQVGASKNTTPSFFTQPTTKGTTSGKK